MAENKPPISPEASPLTSPKEQAKAMLTSGLQADEIATKTGLTRNQVLGLKGRLVRMAKARSNSQEATEPIRPKPTETEEIPLEEPKPNPKPSYSSNILDKLAYFQKLPSKDAIVQLVRQNDLLETALKNNGHEEVTREAYSGYPPSVKTPEDMVDFEMARLIKAKRQKLLLGEDEPKSEQGLFNAYVKGFEHASPKAQADPLAVYRLGRGDEAKTQENAIRAVATNLEDLKLEAMRQEERLDNKKLDFEEKKWEAGQTDKGQLIGLASEALKGPIGKAIESLGSSAADRLRTGKQRDLGPIQPTQVVCPQCKKPFFADPRQSIIICGNCGSNLAKQPSQAQAETPVTQETQEEKILSPEIETPQTEKATEVN
jgi:ribosomal protein L37AE/L43A/DNA-binding CsgD family transcriptional regulator